MVARAHRDTLLVEQGADVVRVNAVGDKRKHGHLLSSGADDAHTGYLAEGLCGHRQQLIFQFEIAIRQLFLHKIYGRSGGNNTGDIGGTCLEFVR